MRRKPLPNLQSPSLINISTCQRRAKLSRWGIYDRWPDGLLKNIVDDYIVKKANYTKLAKDYLHRMRGILEPTGHKLTDLEHVIKWIGRRSDIIVGMNTSLPMALGGKAVDVFIPYIIRRETVIFFTWPVFTTNEITISDIIMRPDICASYLLADRESDLDPTMPYYTVLVTENAVYGLRRNKELKELITTFLNNLVGGISYDTDAATPGAHCSGCPAHSDCTVEQERIDRIPKRKYLSYPSRKMDDLLCKVARRTREGQTDPYDNIIVAAALFTNLTMERISDIYTKKDSKRTGSFTRQHIHESIVKKTIEEALHEVDDHSTRT